ncbi:L-aspartate oxidase [Ammoniphilus sp. CFH 90114]|uniref:L-aspartate oxidase n=1 Tax=Ammoniphilus sp. CFH 90114 TaxID=2493665 RepID=UPI00100F6D5E|nr:L-aspartate oxidase [Ammoniphilus sp. CFH 90114]RXT09020.1 L-aspartate oxidase [Ammoniphilus sp. CFH 90114]
MVPRYLIDFNIRDMNTKRTDVCIIGSGIAGLYTALQIAKYQEVTLICKEGLSESNTNYAQGGIAAVITKKDSTALHRQDTLIAGAGLCSHEAVDVLVNEGPEGVYELIRYGTQFDKEGDKLALTQEGAHSRRRILHARGDSTGAEIVRALSERARENERIHILEHHFAIDLVTEKDQCVGVIVEDSHGEQFLIQSNATILATGGAGQLYRYTTNPPVATGDGIAMAYRAGAQIKDVEFIQFHPTSLCYPGAPRFLISEAVRGEGAVLRNVNGERFMERYHPQLELAPRDVVARAIVSEIEKTESTFVYLDITHESEELIKHRFPKIYQVCLTYGLNMVTDWIPVAPAAHYMMGGVKTGLWGETTVPRLFACGEVSCTGVHGANRLASNSLSEAIVFGKRIAQRVKELQPIELDVSGLSFSIMRETTPDEHILEKKLKLQKMMVRQVGLKRDEKRLRKALKEMERQVKQFQLQPTHPSEYEFLNLLTCGLLTVKAALLREESRGGHYREDFPKRDDVIWRKHIIQSIGEGVLEERGTYDD